MDDINDAISVEQKRSPEEIIDQWFQDHFPGSVEVAGYTPAWNKVTEAVADLKRRFKED